MFTVCMYYKTKPRRYAQPYFFACKPFFAQFGYNLTQSLFVALTRPAMRVSYHIAHIINATAFYGENLVIRLKVQPSFLFHVFDRAPVDLVQELFAI